MIVEGKIHNLSDDSCYSFVDLETVQHGVLKFSAGFSPGDSSLRRGDPASFDLKIDSVIKIEKLTGVSDGGLVQTKGISVEVVGRVSSILADDEIKVTVPGFGEIEVSLEGRMDPDLGQCIRFRGCLSAIEE